jgi:SAM-dependent methyltransferase
MFVAGYRRAALALLASALIGGCTWPGGGFKASGPEMPRLKDALALRAGMVVADVGAGKGELTLALAAAVGSAGHVYSSEIDPSRLRALREKVAAAGLGNVTFVEAKSSDSGLPAGCCDAIVLRRVYHHVTEPAATNASLLRALRPGGVLAVIDIPPPFFFFERSSLGIAPQIVIDEVTAAGFELLRLRTDWPGRGPLESYCALFRKPASGRAGGRRIRRPPCVPARRAPRARRC